jgi:hypothetical protein
MAKQSPHIVTHRGLDPSYESFIWKESTLEAFAEHLARGYGIEFDIRLSKDGEFIVIHDADLARHTGGIDTRKICEIIAEDLPILSSPSGSLGTLESVLKLLNDAENGLGALHIKHYLQDEVTLAKLSAVLLRFDLANKLLLFDVAPEAARKIKQFIPQYQLAPSVSHPYDIARFGAVVGNTLISIEDAIANRNIFDWVWLDEWDLVDCDCKKKLLYSAECFERLRACGYKIAVISPELHATSPGLLGGECHPDAESMAKLQNRLNEIAALSPDLICTDYPDLANAIFNQA